MEFRPRDRAVVLLCLGLEHKQLQVNRRFVALKSWHSALLLAQRLHCLPARPQFFKMPAQPHMTYSQQHAAAKLIPKGPDIENATRSPDSLLAFVNMFRDIEAPDDSPDAVTTRETFL